MNQKNRPLLVVTTSYPSSDFPASGIFVKRLNRALSEYFCVTTVCPSANADFSSDVLPARYAPLNMEVLAHYPGGIPVAIRRKPYLICLVPLMLLSMLFSILKELRKSEAVISHWAVNGVLTGIANLFYKRSSIIVFHGTDANSVAASKISRLVAWLAIRLNDRTIAVSQHIAGNLKEKFPKLAHKIRFIPNGVEEALLELDDSPKGEVNIVSIANLNPLKGVQDILNALSSIVELPFNLTVVGDGDMKEELKQLADINGLGKKVKFIGSIAPEDVKNVLGGSNIFVLASYSEGRPSVVLEAMASATCVCASALPGIEEFVTDEENGLLFPVGDVEALSDILNKLICDSGLRNLLGKKGREYIQNEELTWSATAKCYMEVIDAA